MAERVRAWVRKRASRSGPPMARRAWNPSSARPRPWRGIVAAPRHSGSAWVHCGSGFHPRHRRPRAMTHLKVNRTELTPVSFLVRSAYVFPDKAAVVHGSRRYTYRQLAERVNRLASALRAVGLQKHDRVAFLCPNIPPMLEAHYGVPAAGGVLVAINTRLSSDEIGYILGHSGARFLFVDAELLPVVKLLDLGGVRVVRVDDTGGAGDPYEDFLATG